MDSESSNIGAIQATKTLCIASPMSHVSNEAYCTWRYILNIDMELLTSRQPLISIFFRHLREELFTSHI